MAEPQEQLGDRIARFRRARGWTQADLAGLLGVKAAQIGKMERGASQPRLSVLRSLAQVFGTSADYLLTGREPGRVEPDQLIALWPALERLPMGLRNEIGEFLKTVIYAQTVAGLGGQDRQQRPSTSSIEASRRRKPAARRRKK